MPAVRALTDAALIVLGTARLTRLITEDDLGRWYFRDPIEGWGYRAEKAVLDQAVLALQENPDADGVLGEELAEYDESRPWSWRMRLASGAGCRWCIGFWIGAVVLTVDVLTRTTVFGWARPVFRFGLGVLALNAVSNAVGRWTGTLS
jgi:hypothetical protein